MDQGDQDRVDLGEVTVPSGTLIVTDMGYLGTWSGSNPPAHVPGQITDPVLRESIAAAQDFRVVGPDAEAAARALNLQSLTFVYDIPRHGVPSVSARFESAIKIKEHGFDARLEPEASRVPHRERARRAAAAGGADFLIDGVWSVAIGNLPTDRPLKVTAVRQEYGEGVGPRWSDITTDVDSRPDTNSRVGLVGVDWARMIVIDADALESWVHERSLDGLADVAFWGRDVERAREVFGGDDLEGRTVGWTNLPES